MHNLAEDFPAPDSWSGQDAEGGSDDVGSPAIARDSRRTVWLVYDGARVVDVRVNANWHARLGSVARLEAAFQEACAAGMLQLDAVAADDAPSLEGIVFDTLPELGPAALDAYLRMMDDHERAWQEALDAAATTRLDAAPAVRVVDGPVAVTLNPGGLPSSVQFEPRWIVAAQPGTIAASVLHAITQAQAQFEPTEHPLEDTLRAHELRHRVLLEGLRALIAGRR